MAVHREELGNRERDSVSVKRWLVFLHDLAWIPVCIVAAYWIRFNLNYIPSGNWKGIGELVLIAFLVYGTTFWFFGCYRGIWRYASIPDLVRLAKAVIVAAPVTVLICFLIGRLEGIPRSVLVLYPFMMVGGLTTARVAYRAVKDHGFSMEFGERQRAILVGAGRAGEMLLRDLERSRQFEPIAFVDDDPGKQGHDIRGVRVRGTTDDLFTLINKYSADIVLVTMPSASRDVMSKVVTLCAKCSIKCVTLPSLMELADGRVEVSRLRPVTVEDLLGREPVTLDRQAISEFIRGKRVLVTGGGGSIGSELCRQIGSYGPELLTVLDNHEYNLYRIDQELAALYPDLVFTSVLSDIRDAGAIGRVFAQFKPQVVFHAAAYKHVPMVEDNIIEGVRNNVYGTRVVADAALQYGVGKFVLISTDKTVNPTNVMGTTKRVAELYCQALNESSEVQFVTTRFGNVLASAGSVVPLFERQIAAGGPVTVTHPDITRYFMTIPEAARLILQAGAIGKGGEIFVLDMGEPVRISDLAEKLIQLSGLQPGRDIQVVYTGLRPGEKMHEELFYAQEELKHTAHPKVMLASSCTVDRDRIVNGLMQLGKALESNDQDQALVELKSMVPEFNPSLSAEQRKSRQRHTQLQIVK